MLLHRTLITFMACHSCTLQDCVFPWVRHEKRYLENSAEVIQESRLLMIYIRGEWQVLDIKISRLNWLVKAMYLEGKNTYVILLIIIPMYFPWTGGWKSRGLLLHLIFLHFPLSPFLGVISSWTFLMRQSQTPLNCHSAFPRVCWSK